MFAKQIVRVKCLSMVRILSILYFTLPTLTLGSPIERPHYFSPAQSLVTRETSEHIASEIKLWAMEKAEASGLTQLELLTKVKSDKKLQKQILDKVVERLHQTKQQVKIDLKSIDEWGVMTEKNPGEDKILGIQFLDQNYFYCFPCKTFPDPNPFFEWGIYPRKKRQNK